MSTSELPNPKTSTVALIGPLEFIRGGSSHWRRSWSTARGTAGLRRRVANRPGLDKLARAPDAAGRERVFGGLAAAAPWRKTNEDGEDARADAEPPASDFGARRLRFDLARTTGDRIPRR